MKILDAIRASRKRLKGAREALQVREAAALAKEWEKEEEEWATAYRQADEEEEERATALLIARAEVWAEGWQRRRARQAVDAAAAACPSVNLLQML